MKKNIFMLVILTVALVGCKDNAEVRSALGTYSYKTSGIWQIDTTRIALSEQGAMEIISLKNQDSVLVTFNMLMGGVYSTHASIAGDQITLQPFIRQMVRPLSSDSVTEIIDIHVNGSGHVYDKNILMTMHYDAMTKDSLNLSADNVQLIAKKNK